MAQWIDANDLVDEPANVPPLWAAAPDRRPCPFHADDMLSCPDIEESPLRNRHPDHVACRHFRIALTVGGFVATCVRPQAMEH